MRKIIIIIVITLMVLGLGFYLFKLSDSTPTVTSTNEETATPQIKTNFLAPKPSDDQLKQNMQKAELDVLSQEGTALHIHQHLDMTVNGQNFPIPADIGVAGNFISPLHVHDDTGILHVESPVVKNFKLGQFFTEWGVNFSADCISNFCTNTTHKLIIAVNGQAITDPVNYILKAHDEIQIWYGLKTENPSLIKSYDFPQGQ